MDFVWEEEETAGCYSAEMPDGTLKVTRFANKPGYGISFYPSGSISGRGLPSSKRTLDSAMKAAEDAYMSGRLRAVGGRARNNPGYNDPRYRFYVVNAAAGTIDSGWEFREDAMERAVELRDEGGQPKVMTKPRVGSRALDPDDDSCWEVGSAENQWQPPRSNPRSPLAAELAEVQSDLSEAFRRLELEEDPEMQEAIEEEIEELERRRDEIAVVRRRPGYVLHHVPLRKRRPRSNPRPSWQGVDDRNEQVRVLRNVRGLLMKATNLPDRREKLIKKAHADLRAVGSQRGWTDELLRLEMLLSNFSVDESDRLQRSGLRTAVRVLDKALEE